MSATKRKRMSKTAAMTSQLQRKRVRKLWNEKTSGIKSRKMNCLRAWQQRLWGSRFHRISCGKCSFGKPINIIEMFHERTQDFIILELRRREASQTFHENRGHLSPKVDFVNLKKGRHCGRGLSIYACRIWRNNLSSIHHKVNTKLLERQVLSTKRSINFVYQSHLD